MISLKELVGKTHDDARLVIVRRHVVGADVVTTAGEAWSELAATGRDYKVDYVTHKPCGLVVTVSPEEG